jgi:hypothetical protein
MTTLWDRRIRHFDRPIKATRLRCVRRQLLKADVRRRRGLPSGHLPADWVFEKLRLKRAKSGPHAQAARERLERARMHDRMLERKRDQRDAARRRARPSVLNTKINLWRRRRDWLRRVEAPVQPQD